ncbi:MAG: hypothetical protein MK110_13005 [Fuerstiella sp.]|nr:hypothetical protein [Fuerstiella sp.]
MHVKEAQNRLGSGFTWLCDTMDNVAKHQFGDAPNSEFVIAPEGRIVRSRSWSDPDQLRKDLTELVGPVRKPTRESELNLPQIITGRNVSQGVVPRIRRPGRMQAVTVKAEVDSSKDPFYAKLRAEADFDLLRSGSGQMYLGFLIDPLYHVHWNNLSKPLRVAVTATKNSHVEPSILKGPKVHVESDSDPREFLITVENAQRGTEIQLDVFYYACDDDQTWCKAIRQSYTISLETDPDAGRIQKNRSGLRRRSGTRGSLMSIGRVTRIDVRAETITLRMPAGNSQKYRVTNNTSIVRNGRRSPLKAIRKGEMVRYESEPTDTEPTIVRMMTRSTR